MTINFNSSNHDSVEENLTGVVHNVQASLNSGLADAGLTYSISGGVDAGDFTIDTSTGELRFNSTPDYEAPVDDDTDNIYNIVVTASDGVSESAVQGPVYHCHGPRGDRRSGYWFRSFLQSCGLGRRQWF